MPQSRAASLRLKSSSTMAMARMRDACLASLHRLAAPRKSAALISFRVIATAAISAPRESMLTASIHRTGPKGTPLGESRLWAPGIRPAGDPTLPIQREAAAGHDHVHMRVMGHGRAPRMEHRD